MFLENELIFLFLLYNEIIHIREVLKLKLRKISVILLCIMLTTILSGCGNSPDMAGYISAILDNTFKNDSTKFVSMEIGTSEQAAKSY